MVVLRGISMRLSHLNHRVHVLSSSLCESFCNITDSEETAMVFLASERGLARVSFPADPGDHPPYLGGYLHAQRGYPSFPDGHPPYLGGYLHAQRGYPSFPDGHPPYLDGYLHAQRGYPSFPDAHPSRPGVCLHVRSGVLSAL